VTVIEILWHLGPFLIFSSLESYPTHLWTKAYRVVAINTHCYKRHLALKVIVKNKVSQRSQVQSSGASPFHWTKTNFVGGEIEESISVSKNASGSIMSLLSFG